MPNQDLTNYINQAKAEGASDQKIKEDLLKAGWAQIEIDEAFTNRPIIVPNTPSLGIKTSTKTPITKITIIAILAVLLISGTAGAFYYADKQFNWGIFASKKVTEPVACTQEVKQCSNGSYVGRTGPNCEFAECPVDETATVNKGVKQNQAISVPADKTVLDCNNVKDPYCMTKFFDLFEENLKSCKPSKGTTPIGWEQAMGILRGYEILGIQNNLCVINFWFLKTKDIPATLLNKQMTCKYGASERTIEKVAKGENCTGPLLDEFNKLIGQ